MTHWIWVLTPPQATSSTSKTLSLWLMQPRQLEGRWRRRWDGLDPVTLCPLLTDIPSWKYFRSPQYMCGAQSPQLCPDLRDSMDHSSPGSSVHGILQARILEWVATTSSRGSSQPRAWTWVSCTASSSFPLSPWGSPDFLSTDIQRIWDTIPVTGKALMRGTTSECKSGQAYLWMTCAQASSLGNEVHKNCQNQRYANRARTGCGAVRSEPSPEAVFILPGKTPDSFLHLLTFFYLSFYSFSYPHPRYELLETKNMNFLLLYSLQCLAMTWHIVNPQKMVDAYRNKWALFLRKFIY